MKYYLLAMHQPVGDPPPPEVLDPVMRALAWAGKLAGAVRLLPIEVRPFQGDADS